jgi:hypothetical protein
MIEPTTRLVTSKVLSFLRRLTFSSPYPQTNIFRPIYQRYVSDGA